jgi:hypothetical protein
LASATWMMKVLGTAVALKMKSEDRLLAAKFASPWTTILDSSLEPLTAVKW